MRATFLAPKRFIYLAFLAIAIFISIAVIIVVLFFYSSFRSPVDPPEPYPWATTLPSSPLGIHGFQGSHASAPF
jgi:hypothetical protein